jgi:hypothetical protein
VACGIFKRMGLDFFKHHSRLNIEIRYKAMFADVEALDVIKMVLDEYKALEAPHEQE